MAPTHIQLVKRLDHAIRSPSTGVSVENQHGDRDGQWSESVTVTAFGKTAGAILSFDENRKIGIINSIFPPDGEAEDDFLMVIRGYIDDRGYRLVPYHVYAKREPSDYQSTASRKRHQKYAPDSEYWVKPAVDRSSNWKKVETTAETLEDVQKFAKTLGVELEVSLENHGILLYWIKRNKNYRRKGAGRMVLDALIRYANTVGEDITLGVLEKKQSHFLKLIQYYESFGFEITEQIDNPEDDEGYEAHMVYRAS